MSEFFDAAAAIARAQGVAVHQGRAMLVLEINRWIQRHTGQIGSAAHADLLRILNQVVPPKPPKNAP